MRQLTEPERQFVEKIVQLKQAARFEELQVTRLLHKELECFGSVSLSVSGVSLQAF